MIRRVRHIVVYNIEVPESSTEEQLQALYSQPDSIEALLVDVVEEWYESQPMPEDDAGSK